MKILLDAGHYGNVNKSKIVPEYCEARVMWDLHLLLKKELEAYGITVDVTRTSEEKDLNIITRGKKAAGYDLFLSLHTNAAEDTTVNRPVMICYQDLDWTDIDDESEAVGNVLGKAIQKVMGLQKYQIYRKRYKGDRDGDGKQNDEWYGVLYGSRSVNVPGILVENTFHTNQKCCEWLLNPSNLLKLAKAEAEAIADYYKCKKYKSYNVTASVLRIRSGPGTNYSTVGYISDKGVYQISEFKNGFGKLVDGRGWVGNKYLKEVK